MDGGSLEHFETLDMTGVDTSWVKQLGQAGYWDVESAPSPLADRPVSLGEPEPVFTDLVAVGRAHLVAGLLSGDARGAGRDVRQLARLCFTSERIPGAITAIALLGLERRARDAAAQRGLPTDGWDPVSEDDQRALKRLLVAGSLPYTLHAVGAGARWVPPLSCSGAEEVLVADLYMRGFLKSELRHRYAELTQAIETSPCRWRRLRAAWASPAELGQSLPWPADRGVGYSVANRQDFGWYDHYRDAGM
jgi:hypothetical protein